MSLNLGPLVLTVIQFVSAGIGYLFVVTFVPDTVASPEAAVLIGVVGAAIAGSLVYYRAVRPRMPASMLGEDGDREPVEKPPELRDDPGALGAEDLPGPEEREDRQVRNRRNATRGEGGDGDDGESR